MDIIARLPRTQPTELVLTWRQDSHSRARAARRQTHRHTACRQHHKFRQDNCTTARPRVKRIRQQRHADRSARTGTNPVTAPSCSSTRWCSRTPSTLPRPCGCNVDHVRNAQRTRHTHAARKCGGTYAVTKRPSGLSSDGFFHRA
jgi:hypothetical protein